MSQGGGGGGCLPKTNHDDKNDQTAGERVHPRGWKMLKNEQRRRNEIMKRGSEKSIRGCVEEKTRKKKC